MARYEVADEGSFKFWEITLTGRTFTTRWGRIGSKGQTTIKHFETDDEARKQHDRLIAEKRRKGYRLVDGPPAVATAEPPTATTTARNAQLEAEIIAAPDDPAPQLVYADWLTEQGDPRGELIAMQHALKNEKAPDAFLALKRRVEQHQQRHERTLLGEIFEIGRLLKLEWQTGFLRGVRISYGAAAAGDPPIAEVLDCVLALPAALVLQHVGLGTTGVADPRAGRYAAAFEVLARRHPPLRSLHLGDAWPGEREVFEGDHGDLGLLRDCLPQLRKLVIAHGAPHLEAPLPELRVLELRTPLAWTFRTPWPKLELLACTALETAELVAQTASPATFPALTQLRLLRTTRTIDVLAALAGSRLLPQLALVDVAEGDLRDDDLDQLIPLVPQFRHLRSLHLGQQHLSMGGVRRLRDWKLITVTAPRRFQGVGE